jgi:phospholipase/carboxylesterase
METALAFQQDHGLPGKAEAFDDEMLQYNEVAIVVGNEDELAEWVRATRPFQIDILEGVHEHGAAPGIADHIRYVVIRANGADGVIGGAPAGLTSPAATGWSLWIRFYPEGRTIFERPPADRDMFPGRENNLLLPMRRGMPPRTGSTLPHQQLTQLTPPALRASMREWMDTQFTDVRTGPSLVSDHVTWAMHLEGKPLGPRARTLAPIPGAAEFAHMHIDGSWHLSLPAEDRWEVLVKGWGTIHPVARFGVNAILFYSPRNANEFALLKEAVATSYRYAIGELV